MLIGRMEKGERRKRTSNVQLPTPNIEPGKGGQGLITNASLTAETQRGHAQPRSARFILLKWTNFPPELDLHSNPRNLILAAG
jgi:hypothetical protein